MKKKMPKGNTYSANFFNLLMRVFAGVGGGLLGTCAALLTMTGFMASQNAVGGALDLSESFSGGALVAIIFIGSFIANIFSLFLLTVLDGQKYSERKFILKGGFFSNIFLFIVALPFYLFVAKEDFLLYIAGVHLFLAASSSALFAEIFSGIKSAISGVIGVSTAQMILIFIFLGFGVPDGGTLVTILFLPFIWFLLPVFIFCTEKIYCSLSSKIGG